jgi:Mn-dependent DtxR family transcriptional regulator
MLRRVLAQIIGGGALHYSQISKTLNIPEGMVHQMVWELQRLGYLQKTMDDCGEFKCFGCSMGCGEKTPLQTALSLTEKGQRFLQGA